MSWLQKIAAYSPDDIIQGVLNNTFDINWACGQMRIIGAVACDQINFAAGLNAAAYGKMKTLSDAAGCKWNPEPMKQQPMMNNQNILPNQMPQLGEQDKPMESPAVSVGG